MGVYYGVYVVIGLTTLICYSLKSRKMDARKTVCMVALFVLTLMFGLRHPSMGVDLGYGYSYGYLGKFSMIAEFSIKESLLTVVGHYERGYIIFNKIVSLLSDDYQFFLSCCAAASLIPVMYAIYKESSSPAFSIFIFMGLPSFSLLFSGLRQAIAVGICIASTVYIEKRNLHRFVLLVLLAATFHKSALMYLWAYPIYLFPMKRSWRAFTYVIPPAAYVLRYPLFAVLSRVFKENAVPDNNGAITLFLVFCLVYIFCCVFSDESQEIAGMKNLFLAACCIQAMGGVFSTAMRVGYYYMNALIFLLPLLTHNMKRRKNAQIIKLVVGICFIIFGLHTLRNGSWSMSYPYCWFWEW